jgi:hypothetical protein
MNSSVSKRSDIDLSHAQARYLASELPEAKARSIEWRGGKTQLIEIGAGPPTLLIHGGLGEAFQWLP